MSDYINWYVVELRTRLAPHMSIAKAESITREAEYHLKESAENLQMELGLSEESAALSAIEAFGKPETVALTHLGQMNSRVLGLRPIWLASLSAFVAYFCWSFHWMSLGGPFDNFGATWQNGIAAAVGLLALVGFVAACVKGKRSFRLPLLAVTVQFALGAILFASFWAISDDQNEAVMRPSLPVARRELPKYIARLDRVRDFMLEAQTQFASAETGDKLPSVYRNIAEANRTIGSPNDGYYWTPSQSKEYLVPYCYVHSMPDGRLWAFSTEPSFAEAKKQWARISESSLPQIKIQQDKLKQLLSRVNDAADGRMFFFNEFVVLNLVAWTAILLPVFLVLDWSIFAMVRRRRAWPLRSLA